MGTGMYGKPFEGGHDGGGFALAVAFGDLDAQHGFDLVEYLGIERLSGGGHMADGAEVILLDVLLNHESVDGRRRTEGSHLVFFQVGQQLCWNEFIHIVDELGGSYDPLAIDLAPAALGPPGIRHRDVEGVVVQVLPVLCGDDVP